MYKRDDKEGLDMSYAFKKTYSRAVNVDFLGVWYGYSLCFILITPLMFDIQGYGRFCWPHTTPSTPDLRKHWGSLLAARPLP